MRECDPVLVFIKSQLMWNIGSVQHSFKRESSILISAPWAGSIVTVDTVTGGQTNGTEKKKEKEMKFATQEHSTKSLYGAFNAMKDAIVANVQAKYKFGTDIAKAIQDRKKFEVNTIRPVHKIAKL